MEEVPAKPKTEQHIDPWTVTGTDEGIDYDKLIDQFGSQRITQEQIERMERLTGKPAHPWLKRGRKSLFGDSLQGISSPTGTWTRCWTCTRLVSLFTCIPEEDQAVILFTLVISFPLFLQSGSKTLLTCLLSLCVQSFV
jgi:hypothetical protein